MPIIKSAIKRAKQAIRRRERNVVTKHDIKDATKSFIARPTATGLSAAYSELDKAVKKGLIKKNTVARRKAQLSKIAKNAGVKLNVTKKVSTKIVKKATVKAVPTTKKPLTKKVATKKTVTKKPAVKKPVAKKS